MSKMQRIGRVDVEITTHDFSDTDLFIRKLSTGPLTYQEFFSLKITPQVSAKQFTSLLDTTLDNPKVRSLHFVNESHARESKIDGKIKILKCKLLEKKHPTEDGEPHIFLDEISISGESLTIHQIKPIAEIIRATPSIQYLHLSDDNLSNKSIDRFTSKLRGRQFIELDLSNNHIKYTGMYQVIESLVRPNHLLKSLDISGNHTGNHLSSEVARAINHSNEITNLRLGSNGIFDNGLSKLMKPIAKMPTLKALDLSGNKFGSGVCDILTNFIRSSNSLLSFGVASSFQDQEHLASIAPSFTNNSTILDCDIKRNTIVKDALKANRKEAKHRIHHLDNDSSPISIQDYNKLIAQQDSHFTLPISGTPPKPEAKTLGSRNHESLENLYELKKFTQINQVRHYKGLVSEGLPEGVPEVIPTGILEKLFEKLNPDNMGMVASYLNESDFEALCIASYNLLNHALRYLDRSKPIKYKLFDLDYLMDAVESRYVGYYEPNTSMLAHDRINARVLFSFLHTEKEIMRGAADLMLKNEIQNEPQNNAPDNAQNNVQNPPKNEGEDTSGGELTTDNEHHYQTDAKLIGDNVI